jgi:predicted nucleotidyltransferase
MPVDIDRFEQGSPARDTTTSERILRFLAARDAQAFTRRELAEAIDRDPETVGTNLTRLKDRGLVRHRAPYWAFTDDREHARAVLEARYDDEVVATILGDAGATDSSAVRSPHRTAAEAYFDRVGDRLDDAVEALYLFGSVARGAETASSDVDVLVVVADEVDFAAVDDLLLELAYEVQLEHEVPIEVHSVRAGEFADRRDRGEPFVRSVLAEAEAGG